MFTRKERRKEKRAEGPPALQPIRTVRPVEKGKKKGGKRKERRRKERKRGNTHIDWNPIAMRNPNFDLRERKRDKKGGQRVKYNHVLNVEEFEQPLLDLEGEKKKERKRGRKKRRRKKEDGRKNRLQTARGTLFFEDNHFHLNELRRKQRKGKEKERRMSASAETGYWRASIPSLPIGYRPVAVGTPQERKRGKKKAMVSNASGSVRLTATIATTSTPPIARVRHKKKKKKRKRKRREKKRKTSEQNR